MIINKVNISNYKIFESFSIEFTSGINIIVGNNEAGKSTILEAIHLVLTGLVNGKYANNEISQHLFNYTASNNYLTGIKKGDNPDLPKIEIEIFFSDKVKPEFKGNNNSERKDTQGVIFKIEFDDRYRNSYEELLKEKDKLTSIPIEYYRITLMSFARDNIITRQIPIKSVLIDSASNRYQNGSDIYLSRIIRNDLDEAEKASLSQAYRQMRDAFTKNSAITNINNKIKEKSLTNKKIEISAELTTKNAWEATLMTYLDGIPFHQIGKGEQCIIKTNLALGHKKTEEASLILIEEPENHLSHTKLNELTKRISDQCCDNQKQVIVSTHSSFVANTLGLEKIILINNLMTTRLSDLSEDTFNFFKKLPGYNTLRLILCTKAVLVEGDSDELIFQRVYKDQYKCLPIEDGIDVISVAMSFKRFLEIAKKIKMPVAVITDNDGDYEKNIKKKYADFLNIPFIKICASDDNSLNTLEPQFIKAQDPGSLTSLCTLLNKEKDKLPEYMLNNKTTWALKVFESEKAFLYPQYINEAVAWCKDAQ